MFNPNSRFNRFNKFNKNKNNKNNTSTNITVEKIDTTETTRQESSNKSKIPEFKSKTCESVKESKSKSKTSESKSKQDSKKLTHTLDNDIINNIETLDELPLVLSNVSENEKHSVIDTETLLYAKKQKNKLNKTNKSTKYTLNFPKTIVVDTNKYDIINKYVKKNYYTIVDLLYKKNLLKNKNSPYRIVYHIYVNYLNEDLNIIIK